MKFNESLIIAIGISLTASCAHSSVKTPNFVVIFCDDMGYGDIGVFGHPTIHTPNIDQMAAEGQKWTNFYVGASVCTPSRAALLTGRLPIRSGTCGDRPRVFFPDSKGGLPQSEISLARILKENDYATACIGKWHLGHLEQFMPTSHGFDYFYGIPYSNDMDLLPGLNKQHESIHGKSEYFNVPLIEGTEIIERPVDQVTLTRRLTEKSVEFIENHKDSPFFLYLAHPMPHVPLFASPEFQGKSRRGIYGDVIEELDWSVGQIMKTLTSLGLEENTLVVFTSDNGPWLIFDDHGGTSGLLRGGKGETFEGGFRVPAVFWWPGIIKPGVVMDPACTMDLFPTFCNLAGIELPADRMYDGYDITGLIRRTGKREKETIYFYWGTSLYAIRDGKYKAHFITRSEGRVGADVFKHEVPYLYDLEVDPSEKYNIASNHPEVIEKLTLIREKHEAGVVPVINQVMLK